MSLVLHIRDIQEATSALLSALEGRRCSRVVLSAWRLCRVIRKALADPQVSFSNVKQAVKDVVRDW